MFAHCSIGGHNNTRLQGYTENGLDFIGTRGEEKQEGWKEKTVYTIQWTQQ